MKYNQPLIPANLIKRYKRFLADIRLDSGEEITVHCANSGSMKTCIGDNWEVMISDSQNPKRKLRFTLEMIHNGVCWIGINTHLANHIVKEAILGGSIPELSNYKELKTEVPYGEQKSRIDILLTNPNQQCYVEIKTVSMVNEQGDYSFPDAVTTRGQKHLEELMLMVKEGHRAVLLFLIQRSDGNKFTPARDIDPKYSELLEKAKYAGVEILPYDTTITPKELKIKNLVELLL